MYAKRFKIARLITLDIFMLEIVTALLAFVSRLLSDNRQTDLP